MEAPPLILLTGAPGAGKSSVARALLGRFAHGLHIPVDTLRELVVAGIAHPVPEWTAETSRQFGLARATAAAMARLYLAAGFAVAIDDVIAPEDADAHFAELAAERSPLKVLLYPDLATTLERNQRRTGKAFDPLGLEPAIRHLHSTTDPARYARHGWQIIDTSAHTIEQTVDAILAAVAAAPARPVDQHGVLDEAVFSYRVSRDKVFIAWHGKQVMVLKNEQARRFLGKIEHLEGKDAQLVMAKVTGNFKRGNER